MNFFLVSMAALTAVNLLNACLLVYCALQALRTARMNGDTARLLTKIGEGQRRSRTEQEIADGARPAGQRFQL